MILNQTNDFKDTTVLSWNSQPENWSVPKLWGQFFSVTSTYQSANKRLCAPDLSTKFTHLPVCIFWTSQRSVSQMKRTDSVDDSAEPEEGNHSWESQPTLSHFWSVNNPEFKMGVEKHIVYTAVIYSKYLKKCLLKTLHEITLMKTEIKARILIQNFVPPHWTWLALFENLFYGVLFEFHRFQHSHNTRNYNSFQYQNHNLKKFQSRPLYNMGLKI